jgi:hypothetical protein
MKKAAHAVVDCFVLGTTLFAAAMVSIFPKHEMDGAGSRLALAAVSIRAVQCATPPEMHLSGSALLIDCVDS